MSVALASQEPWRSPEGQRNSSSLCQQEFMEGVYGKGHLSWRRSSWGPARVHQSRILLWAGRLVSAIFFCTGYKKDTLPLKKPSQNWSDMHSSQTTMLSKSTAMGKSWCFPLLARALGTATEKQLALLHCSTSPAAINKTSCRIRNKCIHGIWHICCVMFCSPTSFLCSSSVLLKVICSTSTLRVLPIREQNAETAIKVLLNEMRQITGKLASSSCFLLLGFIILM